MMVYVAERPCSQLLLIELATFMLKIYLLKENCVGISWINGGALQALSTGFIAGESEPHKLSSVWESMTIGSSALTCGG